MHRCLLIREAVGASVDVVVFDNSCTGDSCTAASDDAGDAYSACGVYRCYPCFGAGTYEISVTVSGVSGYLGYSFDIIAVNQYLPLTSTVQSSIGVMQHFYSYTSTFESLVFQLTVTNGPSVQFFVFDGCASTFEEDVVCAFGDCFVYIPTEAKRSAQTVFYIILTSSTLNDNDFLDRDNAYGSIKPSEYTLSVNAGTANCIAASSIVSQLDFCSDVLSGISSDSIWSFENVQLKDQEAECLFNDLSEGLTCPLASNECLDWLKTLSCLITFPQCDGNGFQAPVCRDVCSLVNDNCGANWPSQTEDIFGFFLAGSYDCGTDFYVDKSNTTSTTCYPLPSPPPPPASLDDYKPVSAGPAVLDPFVVPQFSDVTIYLTTGEVGEHDSTIHTSGGSTKTNSDVTTNHHSSGSSSAAIVLPSIFASLFLIFML